MSNVSSPSIVVVSDDLTGAVAAAAEAARGGATTDVRAWSAVSATPVEADALVIDTHSRLTPEPVAAARVADLACNLAARFPQALPYKRVDSLLRGNTAVEVETWAAAVQRPAIVAVGAPAYAITTLRGIQHKNGVAIDVDDGNLDGTRRHPIALLAAEHIDIERLRAPDLVRQLEHITASGRHAVVDTAEVSDLQHLSKAVVSMSQPVGLVGSYGLLGAWVEALRAADRMVVDHPPALVVATSYRAATRQQIEAFGQGSNVAVVDGTAAVADAVDEAVNALGRGKHVAITTVGRDVAFEPRPDVAIHAAQIVARVLMQRTPSGLVLLGGEVSSALVGMLRPDHLEVLSEPWPATPVMRVVGGSNDGLLAVIQSGSQGEHTRTIHAVEMLSAIAAGRMTPPISTLTGGRP
ncbi:uncharacterized protein YgbK (DUF1537 family) [Georgenia soli]|uniref:Uncharacterized protein YgbK (DUF1537 family) n=1 Tax=Georgenia soli TaxID=638953 RepID=A0A2A9F1D8_9MICO|nr:four-carbon acid sugar kinase family protein [Georgenia soli]PFG45124.1 uncharacterized protein YgbK (DUF1537 family) [Georgenia soli]